MPGVSTEQSSAAGEQTVSQVDEAAIIALLQQHYPVTTQGVEIGPGDDAAALHLPTGRVLTTVDTLVQGLDFLPVWPCGYRTTGEDLGYKSAAQNLSDINAMGGVPRAGFVTLSLPPDTPLSWVAGYARGVAQAAADLGADRFGVLGGDLSSAGELQIGMTVLGEAEGPVLTRSGARPGDRLLVAGEVLGAADAALSLLTSATPPRGVGQRVLQALFRPRPPLGAGAAPGLTAGLDLSDGLVRDAARLASASGVALALGEAELEVEAERLREFAGEWAGDALRRVLYGGEDFLLLATCRGVDPVPDGFRQIGEVREGSGVWLGRRELTTEQGWDHFG